MNKIIASEKNNKKLLTKRLKSNIIIKRFEEKPKQNIAEWSSR